jgi:hypothetical protein
VGKVVVVGKVVIKHVSKVPHPSMTPFKIRYLQKTKITDLVNWVLFWLFQVDYLTKVTPLSNPNLPFLSQS